MRINMTRKLKHLLIIRLITGITLFFFGFFHLLDNTNFTALLRITNLPLVEFNAIFIPLSDFLVGIFLILGLFTRFAAAISFITTVLISWVCITVMQMDPSNLPDGLTQKPFYPPIFLSIIICIFTLYLAIFGAGAYSIDNRVKK